MTTRQGQVGLPAGQKYPSLDQIAPNLEGEMTNFRSTVTGLMKQLDVKYWLDPGLDGQITFSFKQSRLSDVLTNLCTQVGGDFQVVGDTVRIYGRGAYDHYDQDRNYYRFAPCTPTLTMNFSKSELYVSPKQTKGGTYDTLYEAIHLAGYKTMNLMSYGESGFAIVLPFETIDADGVPFVKRKGARPSNKSRFHFKLPYLPKLGMARLEELFAGGYDNENLDYRVIVLAVTADSKVSSPSPLKPGEGDAVLDLAFRDQKWPRVPTLTAFVYEFRRPSGARMATLLKPGMSKLSAGQHLILAGLWTTKELGK